MIGSSEQRYDSAIVWGNAPASAFSRAQTSITAWERHLLVTDIGPVVVLSPGLLTDDDDKHHDEALIHGAQGISIELYKLLYLALLLR